ncbi:fe2+ zn2+ uptake regulation protein [Pseudomonas sp.]|uniref:fe2+ zn2+ uptake regulation protein n=1 Tax=Pseudomonas sp. TaxID=306 RepID=UPI003F34008B
MLNHSASATHAPLKFRSTPAHRAFEFERSCNEHIRALLRYYGLRTSLIRLKVIDALLVAAREGTPIGVRGVHAYLQSFSADLSFISVREVLKRLSEEGVIVFAADKSYCFTAQAIEILEAHSDREDSAAYIGR